MIIGIKSAGNKVTVDALKTKLLQDISVVKLDSSSKKADSALYTSNSRGAVYKTNHKNMIKCDSDKIKKSPMCYNCNGCGHITKS